MSELVANIATILVILFALTSFLLVLQGEFFFGGFVLTFVAFALYVRETNS